MLFRLRETGQVVTEYEFRQLNNTTSFPDTLTPDILNDFGVDPVLTAPQPTLDEFQVVAMDGCVQDAKGNWVENWVVKPMFVAYTDENGNKISVASQKAAYTAARLEEKRRNMVISPLQAKIALYNAGLLDDVEAYIGAAETSVTVKLAWANATEFRRLSPMVTNIAGVLKLTDTQLDELFDAGTQIVV